MNPIKAVATPHSGPQSSTPAWRTTVGPSVLGIKILLLFASRPLLMSDLGCRLFRVRTSGIFTRLAFQSPQPEPNSKRVLLRGEGGFGMKMPCVHKPQSPTLSHLGRDLPKAYLRNSTKLASGSCILQRETVLGEQTSPPMRFCSGTQCLPISHLALCYPLGQGGSGLPLAPWALLLG